MVWEVGKWPGYMTIITKNNGKLSIFRKSQNQIMCDPSKYTNVLPITGHHCVPDHSQLLPLPTPDLVPRAEEQTSTVTRAYPAAVVGVGAGWGGLHGDTGQSDVLGCNGGVVGCSGEGRATDCCHGSQIVSYGESSHTVVAPTSPASDTIAGVDKLSQVVQLSSSPLIPSLHHHKSSGTQ